MARDDLSLLAAFLTVAEKRSFTRAAKESNVATSSLSRAVRRLEEEIGVRLLARTTRSVLPTDAGNELIEHLKPALADIQATLTRLSSLQGRAVGRVRLLIPRLAATSVFAPKLGQFARDYPDVVLDVTTDDDRHIDLVARGFDAGIHYGEYIAQDMIAVRVSPDHRPAIVASPTYFKQRAKPRVPQDLLKHRCISFRHGTDGEYRWEFDKGKKSLKVAVTGSLILDDVALMTRAALDGAGVAFMSEDQAAPYLATGALERVLEAWCPPFPGFFLYYPSRRNQPAPLVALISTLRV